MPEMDHQKEYASKSVAGTALGFGIGGTALALLERWGNGGGLLGGNRCGVAAEAEKLSVLEAALAKEKAERYADGIGISTFKDVVNRQDAIQEKNNANFKAAFDAIAKLDKDAAVSAAVQEQQIHCLRRDMNSDIAALRAETTSAIALESERRQCGDRNIMEYVAATYVPGKLIMPLSSICPPAQPAGESK